MKNYHVYIAMSLDGFIAGENGELDWLSIVQEEGEDYGYSEFFESVDIIALGRGTYDSVKGFESWSFADKTVVVFSHDKNAVPIQNEIFFSGSALDFANDSRFINKKVYVDGGHLIHSFLEANLISSFTVSIIPILLGKGIPLFKGGLNQRKLSLVSSKSYQTGLVKLEYKI